MKITKQLRDSVRDDIKKIIEVIKFDLKNADKGTSGIKPMYFLLDIVSRDRAYNDEHPLFVNGRWQRILPFDGRNYCFYYENGCNDDHVRTMLKSIMFELIE